MNGNKQKTLLQLAEEAIYSAKGHYKSADWLKISLSCYISIPLITSFLLLIFIFPESWQRLISFIGLLFSSLALISVWNNNRDKANKIIEQHMDLGNKYLEIYKQIRNLNTDSENLSGEKLNEIQSNITQLDNQTKRLPISFVGRWWAKLRIKKEVGLDWIYQKEDKTN